MKEQQIVDLLSRLERAVTDAAPQVWGAALKQAHVEAMLQIGWALAWGLPAVALCVLCIWAVRKANEDNDPDMVGPVIVTGALSIGLFLACMSQATDAYEYLANPDWRAMQLVAEIIK